MNWVLDGTEYNFIWAYNNNSITKDNKHFTIDIM